MHSSLGVVLVLCIVVVALYPLHPGRGLLLPRRRMLGRPSHCGNSLVHAYPRISPHYPSVPAVLFQVQWRRPQIPLQSASSSSTGTIQYRTGSSDRIRPTTRRSSLAVRWLVLPVVGYWPLGKPTRRRWEFLLWSMCTWGNPVEVKRPRMKEVVDAQPSAAHRRTA
jgi:hypothetical protein